MSEWKTIDSAPRDGRWFLAGCPTSYDVVGGNGFWCGTARYELPDDEDPEIMFSSGYYGPVVSATHWLPLPSPPEPVTE